MTAPDPRAELIADLRRLADWLETNPDVPVQPWAHFELTHFPPNGDDEQEFAEVDRIAAIIGTEVTIEADRRKARQEFGRVAYEAMAISAERMARHQALFSYTGSVEPHMAVTS